MIIPDKFDLTFKIWIQELKRLIALIPKVSTDFLLPIQKRNWNDTFTSSPHKGIPGLGPKKLLQYKSKTFFQFIFFFF